MEKLWFHCKNFNNDYAMLYILDAETKSPSEIMANVVGHGKWRKDHRKIFE